MEELNSLGYKFRGYFFRKSLSSNVNIIEENNQYYIEKKDYDLMKNFYKAHKENSLLSKAEFVKALGGALFCEKNNFFNIKPSFELKKGDFFLKSDLEKAHNYIDEKLKNIEIADSSWTPLSKFLRSSHMDKSVIISSISYLGYEKEDVIKKLRKENSGKLFLAIKESVSQEILTLKEKYSVAELSELKRRDSCLKRFGAINNSCTASWREQVKETSLKNWGTEHPCQSEEIKEKTKENCLKLYGVESTNQLEWKKEKIKKAVKEKYGVDNILQVPEIRQKGLETKRKKYGENFEVLTASQIQLREKNKRKEQEKLQEKLGFSLISIIDAGNSLHRDTPTLRNKIKLWDFKIYKGKLNQYISFSDFEIIRKKYDLSAHSSSSTEELDLLEFVKSIYKGKIKHNCWDVIKPLELDIYIPNKNIAIEYNGLYWHSDASNLKKGEIPDKEKISKNINRHLIKTIDCEKKGIKLLHIFSDDWEYKKEIVKSIIATSLGVFARKLNAEDCRIEKIPLEIYKNFLNKNHLQSYAYANIRVGLYYKGELVQLLGINSKGNHSKKPELVRVANSLNVQVEGGFSKLLNYIDSTFSFKEITSYINRSLYLENSYQINNFKIEKYNKPSYSYINQSSPEKIRIPYYNFMKEKIKKAYEKGELKYWDSEETEALNMYKNGYYRIYDCGTIQVTRSLN